jgi:DNA-binding response OmpR family regulator
MSGNSDESLNLTRASVLVIDGSPHSLDLVVQILRGFGAENVARCSTLEEADKFARTKTFDLIVIDPGIEGGQGYTFISELRHAASPNCHAPVVLTTGHVRRSDVARGRDTGANIVVAKPVSPNVLLQRIQWVARDKRPFVEVGKYIGPDRRFKFEGPPPGEEGRRGADLKAPLGDAVDPNLSQDEVSALIKPQKVML